jgi:hypothetical protein
MSADHHRKRQSLLRRSARGQNADDHAFSHTAAEHTARRDGHRHRCLTGRNDGAFHETAGVNGSNTSPGDSQEILSKVVE